MTESPNAVYAAFGDFLTLAARRVSLSARDVAANVCDALGKSENGALSWWRHLSHGARRAPLSEVEKETLADVLGVDVEAVRLEARKAGL